MAAWAIAVGFGIHHLRDIVPHLHGIKLVLALRPRVFKLRHKSRGRALKTHPSQDLRFFLSQFQEYQIAKDKVDISNFILSIFTVTGIDLVAFTPLQCNSFAVASRSCSRGMCRVISCRENSSGRSRHFSVSCTKMTRSSNVTTVYDVTFARKLAILQFHADFVLLCALMIASHHSSNYLN
jgi:hypothetical protein